MKIFTLCGLLGLAVVAAAQGPGAAAEIRGLTERLRASGDEAERAGLVAAIGDRVRDHVARELNADRLADLRIQLAEAQTASLSWPDAVGAPWVDLDQQTAFASFVALYGGSGAPESKTWIWAFRRRDGRFEAADRTGEDLEGCGLFVEPIPAGRPGETWLLAWGPVFGANQSPIRMRVYAFDGARFETIWSPPDRLQGKVWLNGDALEVSYLDPAQYYERREPPYFRHEGFALTAEGLVEARSALTEAQVIP